MEENSELEEGEAYSYRDDDDSFDPDTDFSYIDEKLQNVLGHHLKDFEGRVSKENLGSKYGGYGSFLPTYERSPSNGSHLKTPQADSKSQISLCNLSMEGTSQNFQPISNVSSVKFGMVSCSDHSLQNSEVPSGGVTGKHDLHLSSVRVSGKINTKDESSSRSSNLTDQRTLGLRIKVSSDKLARKNMAIYSGLGLGDSPSLSLGNSADDSGGTNAVSQETADESPTSILQDMTSFPVLGGVLISPLHDSLLCFIRKEKLCRSSEHVPSLKGGQEYSAMSVDKLVAGMGNGKLIKEKKANLLRKSARAVAQTHGHDATDEYDTASLLKKKSESGSPGGQEINHNDLSYIPPSNSECVFGSQKGTGGASEVSRGIDKDGLSQRSFPSNLVMEDSLESISGQDSGKRQKNGKIRSVQKVLEQAGDSGRYKGNKASAILKAHSGASTCNEDTLAPSNPKVGKKPSVQVQDEINLCSGRIKSLSEGKKSKDNQIKRKTGVVSIKESSRHGVGATATTSHGASTCKSKMHKLKSQKDNYKSTGSCRDSLNSNLEQTNNHLEKQSIDKLNKKVDNQAMQGPSTKDAPSVGTYTVEGRHVAEMIPAVTAPVVINENWVCCDNCQKWRLLPFGTKPEDLPDNWLCSMLNWLPGMNQCDISEEETTKALYALYQLPVTEGQNNVQNDANGAATTISLDHGKHPDQQHQSPYSAAVSIQAKRRGALKEIPKVRGIGRIQISNTIKNQPPAESNVMKKLSSLHHNNSSNLDVKKHVPKQNEKQMNGGDSKSLKMKKKRDADHHGFGSSKKAKIEDKCATYKHKNSDVECERVGLKPNTGLQTDAVGNNIMKYDSSYAEVAKCDTKDRVLLSTKKFGGQTQVSSDGGSLDMRTQNRTNNSLKKRKWENKQNGHDSKEYVKEETSEIGFRREKKSRVQKTVGRDFSSNKGADTKSNNRMIFFISSKGHLVDGREDVRNFDKGHQIQKHRRNFASQPTLNSVDSVRRDVGSGEVSAVATSSSSKVSGSCRNRANFEEVKSSPVESVSSSPLRTSYQDKFTSAAKDNLGKDDRGTDFVPVYLKKTKYESDIDVDHNANCCEIGSEGKNDKVHEDEKNHISRRDFEKQMPSDVIMEKQVIVKGHHDSDIKLCASTNREVASQQNLMQDIVDEVKATRLERETMNGMSKSLSRCESKHVERTRGLPGFQRERMLDEVSIDDSCKADVPKGSRNPGNVSSKNGVTHSLGHHIPDSNGIRVLNASISKSMKSPSQGATISLKEAQELRDYADRLKSSGFDFESNEAYFQAALKFLHGASLLETCGGYGGRNGEMTQIQAYRTTAKLCEFCAHEYEKREEMAAASLAYKCTEVAYMKVVYCKHSSTSRDRIELQATLHITSQGESPSSSAPDVDNINNQVTADRATLSKGTVSHVTGNHAIVARNRPNFIRLLDFTRDVEVAMEASRKSQNFFATASLALEEGQNRDCITIIKKAIDFSFQDVEGLLDLVRLAMEAINRSGFGVAKD